MTSGPLLLYHLGLILLPLAALALTRFRLAPALLVLAVLHHHPMEPMPCDHDPPPMCCALAQSLEAEPGSVVIGMVRVARLRPVPPPPAPESTPASAPAIRGPPANDRFPPPAPCAPAFRAA